MCLENAFFAADNKSGQDGYDTECHESGKSPAVMLLRQADIHAVHAEKHGWNGDEHACKCEDFDSPVEVVAIDDGIRTAYGSE